MGFLVLLSLSYIYREIHILPFLGTSNTDFLVKLEKRERERDREGEREPGSPAERMLRIMGLINKNCSDSKKWYNVIESLSITFRRKLDCFYFKFQCYSLTAAAAAAAAATATHSLPHISPLSIYIYCLVGRCVYHVKTREVPCLCQEKMSSWMNMS